MLTPSAMVKMVKVLGQQPDIKIKSIERVAGKACLEDMAQFHVVACSLQVLCGMPDSEIVHNYFSLLDCTLGKPPEFPKLEISQVLNTKPYTCAQNGKNQS